MVLASLGYATASYDCGILDWRGLDLSGNHSHIEGARALARLISSEAGCTINMLQTTAQQPFRRWNQVFRQGFFGRLEFLDIRENFFTARGAAELANGFRDNETLTALDFRGTVLALEGLWAMGNALKRRKKRFLGLCGNQTRRSSVAASARWRGDSTPSTRRRPRDRVGSMAWGLTKVHAIT